MNRFILATLLAITLMVTSFAAPLTKKLILKVNLPETIWHDPQLDDYLIRFLSRHDQIRLTDSRKLTKAAPGFPENSYDPESLISWGQEVGGGYLLFVDVHSERLERRTTFSLPLIFKKYETVGIVEGELRICDLKSGRMLLAESFRQEKKGPKIFNASPNDTPNDPDIHLTSPEKIRFFRELEEEVTLMIAEKTKQSLGIRR